MKSPWLPVVLVVLFLSGCPTKSEPPKKTVERRPLHGAYDDFDLPLVIQIDPPEAPLEIQKPSGPIKEKDNLQERLNSP